MYGANFVFPRRILVPRKEGVLVPRTHPTAPSSTNLLPTSTARPQCGRAVDVGRRFVLVTRSYIAKIFRTGYIAKKFSTGR